MQKFKHWLKAILPRPIYSLLQKLWDAIFTNYWQQSYSQEGEDVALNRFLENKSCGFYVDVGAHHPQRFSNTYFYYKKGWRGINIDAMPGSMKAFNKMRPRDINLEVPISDRQEVLTYYQFAEPALNGFSLELTQYREQNGLATVINKTPIQTQTLAAILDKYLPVGMTIDFLTIDVEGLDFQVLKSNDWDKYRPHYILAEALGTTLEENLSSDIACYLKERNYRFVARSYNTCFFKRLDA